jgi:hypothetical protein
VRAICDRIGGGFYATILFNQEAADRSNQPFCISACYIHRERVSYGAVSAELIRSIRGNQGTALCSSLRHRWILHPALFGAHPESSFSGEDLDVLLFVQHEEGNKMSPKAYVRPGKTASVVGIIAAALMFIFGIFFFSRLGEDASDIGQIFMVFWLLIVILIIAYYVYNLMSRKSSSAALEVIDLDVPDSGPGVEEKLRSLERMKKDRLITEEEYQQKRQEIMREKW